MTDAVAIEGLGDETEPDDIQGQHHHRSGTLGGKVVEHVVMILL